LLALGVYGALGLDGLLHYRLGLCSQHTLLANLTIWAEATTGLAPKKASAMNPLPATKSPSEGFVFEQMISLVKSLRSGGLGL